MAEVYPDNYVDGELRKRDARIHDLESAVETGRAALTVSQDRVRELEAREATWNMRHERETKIADVATDRAQKLEAVMKSIAMATEPGALYESIAIHNTATQALRGSQSETP